ncbi:MAG: copper chaperone PCu(A)C, partial [Woeseiaceae bacterium]|nr:copper chaperone PCu(A)C [Woeseiaceae bacterium]
VVDDGVARMRRLEKIEIPAGTNTVLAPGGKHLMLMRPTKTPADAVSLQFYDGAMLLLTVTSSKPQDSR